jgi:hypothetical protein
MKKFALAAFAVIAIALGAHVVSAYAYSCTTNCYGSGSYRTCQTNCF